MKNILIILFVILFASKTNAQTESKDKPVIEFENTTHDFGKVWSGSQVAYEFVFVNKGIVPLILTSVKPSCGCTTPEWPREPIMPGQKSKIKAMYNSGSYQGPFAKSITINSNAGSDLQLIIKGEVLDKPKEPKSPVKLQNDGNGEGF
ncbi:MAG: DUF1573 domain-containing protein [Bacteroidetes bacterium]|nr:DUF1573 domain-containing protein [Bacteroidota bacterium]